MSDQIKVTDNRIFDEDGELREEFRHLEAEQQAESRAPKAPEPAATGEPVVTGPPVEEAPSVASQAAAGPAPATEAPPSRADTVDMPSGSGQQVQFLDLLAVLVEPTYLFLGEASLPDGSSAEDLDRARLYIDLLGVLQEKSSGNLDAQEAAVLDDLLYRLRLAYVEKTGA